MKQQTTTRALLRLVALFAIFIIAGCSGSENTPSSSTNVMHVQELLTTFVIGDQTVYTTSDSTPGGQAEAVRYTATQSGTVNTLNLCVATGNTAKEIQLGLYASLANGTKPAALLTSGVITSGSAIVPGQYAISVPQASIVQGTYYWLGLLAPKGKGTAVYCSRGGTSNYGTFATSSTQLTALPATYPTSGTHFSGWTDTFFGSNVTSGSGGSGGQGGIGGQAGSGSGGIGSGGLSGAGGASAGTTGSSGTSSGASGTSGSGGSDSGGMSGSSGSGGASAGAGAGGQSGAGAGGTGGSTCANGASIRQQSEHLIIYPDANDFPDLTVSFSQPVQDGSTVLVFANEFNPHNYGYGTPDAITVKDSTGSSYTLLQVGNDPDDLETNMLFVRQNVTGGPSSITGHYIANEWLDLYAVEVACVAQASVIGSAVQGYNDPYSWPSTTNAGTLQLNGASAFVLAFGISGMAQNGPFSAGPGFVAAGTALNWNGVEGTSRQPSARLESAHVTGATTFTPSFTSTWTWDRALNFSVALQE